jgi:hypothetical protein
MSSATADESELCFHFILHNSSFSLSVRRPAVRSIAWLDMAFASQLALKPVEGGEDNTR